MATPPKLPASSCTRPVLLSLALLAMVGMGAALRPPLTSRDTTPKAVRLIEFEGTWNVDARTEILTILAENPDVRVDRPDDTLYRAMEAAELDERGAMAALIELKLSDNAQFRDPAGACKLLQTAVARGDQAMARRLAGCRGS